LDIGKESGGIEDADAFAELIAIERLAGFLRNHLQQVAGIGNVGEFDGLHNASGVGGHGGEGGWSFGRLRLLRRRESWRAGTGDRSEEKHNKEQ